MASTFKLSLCGAYVVEDDGAPHPTIWTRAEAVERQGRLERLGAENEADADRARIEGRLTDVDAYTRCASIMLTMATDLLVVLQGAEQKAAA